MPTITRCVFCSQQAERLAARGEVSNNDPEVVQPESDDEEETEVVYHSNTVGFCPDWGVTADGFED